MSIAGWFRSLFARQQQDQPLPIVAPSEPLTPDPLKFSDAVLDDLRRKAKPQSPFTGLPKPPPGVRPDAPKPSMAMDDANGAPGGAWGAWATGGVWGEGLFFPGYPYLAELAQRPEYRNIVETRAEECTRKWIKLLSTGDAKKDKIAKIEDRVKKIGMREAFHRAMELDGFFGMGMLYVDLMNGSTPVSDDKDELNKPLLLDAAKIPKGSLRGFVAVDPTWTSPNYYNSTDPLKPDFFKPSEFYVMGKRVHESRLLIMRSREVPDILKAAYNFGGLSLSQMAKPYVDNWLRTRQSVSDIIHSFTVFVLKTNLTSLLQNSTAMLQRIAAFILGRDNKGLMLVDKNSEDFENVSAPLGSLDKLQAQSQEQMASVSRTALIKLLSITPTGLNATTDGEIRVFYDLIKALQEKAMGAQVTRALQIIQLSEFGEIDEGITFEFVPLWELDAAGKAAVEKTKADTSAVYITASVVSNEEVRTQLAGDPESMYHGLEGEAPEMMPDEGDLDVSGSDPSEQIDKQAEEGSEAGANSGV